MSICEIKDQCRLCSSPALELVLDMGHSPIGEDYTLPEQAHKEQALFPVRLMRCTACGNIQLSVVLDKSAVYTDYLYETSRSLGLDRHFETYAATVMRLPGIQKGQLAIDMGSNVGTFLHALQKHGLSVQGVEPAQRIAQAANAAGIPTANDFFDETFAQRFCTEHGQASIITANNVFANIDNLDAVLNAVNILLAPEGYFIVESGYALDLIQNFVIDNIYHEHLNYFLLTPLQQFFARHSLRIVRAERVPTKGGSLRVYARRMSLNETADFSVEGLCTLERELQFTNMTPFKVFAATAREKRENILREVDARAQQGSMAAFGAAIGGTALLYWLGITESVDFIIDDNPLMHGRLSPGAHITVMDPKILYTRKPETIVNLSWRYLLPIMKRHHAYLQQGGRILQLLPEAKLW